MKRAMTFIATVLCAGAFAQPGTPWERRWHPTASGPDEGMAVCSDKFGNFYVVGTTSNYSDTEDIVVLSYDVNGNLRWNQHYETPLLDKGAAIACDDNGDVIVAGTSQSSTTGYDFVIWKLAGDTGTQRWDAVRVTSSGTRNDIPMDMVVTPAGEIYVTGVSWPLPSGHPDFLTIRIHADGQMAWDAPVQQDFEAKWDIPFALVVHTDGSITVGGSSWEYPDERTRDWALVRYNGNGTVASGRWPFRYNRGVQILDNHLADLAIDEQGNVYATGYCFEQIEADNQDQAYMTQGFRPNGDTMWSSDAIFSLTEVVEFGGDAAFAIGYCDGNVYVAGASQNSVRPAHDTDLVVIGYQAGNGTLLGGNFPAIFNSTDDGADGPKRLITAGSNIYVTGTAVKAGGSDYITMRVRSNGTIAWAREHFTQVGTVDEARGIANSGVGRVAVTGLADGLGATGDDVGTIGYAETGQIQVVTPSSHSIQSGLEVSGSLSSVFLSDDDRWEFKQGPSVDLWPIKLVLIGGVGEVSEMSFRLETHVTTTSIRQRVEFWDYGSTAWVEMDSRYATVNSDRVVIPFSQCDPSRFRSQSGEIKVRISFKVDGIGTTADWRARIDHAVWEVLPR